jgi:hypothetical protein
MIAVFADGSKSMQNGICCVSIVFGYFGKLTVFDGGTFKSKAMFY